MDRGIEAVVPTSSGAVDAAVKGRDQRRGKSWWGVPPPRRVVVDLDVLFALTSNGKAQVVKADTRPNVVTYRERGSMRRWRIVPAAMR